jgi:predicted peroxiredoxin
MTRITAALLAISLILGGAATPVAADTQKTIFYNLTTDEAWSAGMAVGQATKALESGYQVVIFLNVRAVLLASKTFVSDTNGQVGMSVQEQIKGAMSKGAQVIICPMCLAKVGMTMDDVIEGVVKGGPDTTLKAMTADGTVIISY